MSSRFDKSARIPVTFNTPCPAPAAEPVPANRPLDPAEANSDWHWLDCMKRAGFSIVRIVGEYDEALLNKAGLGFELRIGEELENAGLGHFDSLKKGEEFHAFFYLTYRPEDGVKAIRAALERFGLAQICLVEIADAQAKKWLPAPKNAPPA